MSLPSGSMPGRARARAPVARMMFFAPSSTSLPSLAVTATLPGPASFAAPSNTVTLFFFSRCLTPPESWPATARDRLTTFWKSKRTLSAAKP